MSRPIVVTACMAQSSESGHPRRPWHLRAGGGAVHSIRSRRASMIRNQPHTLKRHSLGYDSMTQLTQWWFWIGGFTMWSGLSRREEIAMRRILILVAITIGFASPTWAQKSAAEQEFLQIRQKMSLDVADAINNKKDPAVVADHY